MCICGRFGKSATDTVQAVLLVYLYLYQTNYLNTRSDLKTCSYFHDTQLLDYEVESINRGLDEVFTKNTKKQLKWPQLQLAFSSSWFCYKLS